MPDEDKQVHDAAEALAFHAFELACGYLSRQCPGFDWYSIFMDIAQDDLTEGKHAETDN